MGSAVCWADAHRPTLLRAENVPGSSTTRMPLIQRRLLGGQLRTLAQASSHSPARLLTACDDAAVGARCQPERGRSLHAVADRYHALPSMWNPSDDADAVARAHDTASDTEHASAENDALAPLQAQRGYGRPAGRTDPHSGDRYRKSRDLQDPSHRDGYTAPHGFSSHRAKIDPCSGVTPARSPSRGSCCSRAGEEFRWSWLSYVLGVIAASVRRAGIADAGAMPPRAIPREPRSVLSRAWPRLPGVVRVRAQRRVDAGSHTAGQARVKGCRLQVSSRSSVSAPAVLWPSPAPD
jgi:hypothetical protein